MSQLDEKINSLSSDELDLLNSDPQLLSDFKTKFSAPPTSTENVLGAVGSQLKSSLLPNTETALQPLSGTPQEQLGQALSPTEGLSRIGQTLRAPSELAGQKVEEFGKEINAPITGKLGGMITQTALDPLTYMGTSLSSKAIKSEALPMAKNFMNEMKDTILGLFTKSASQEEVTQGVKNIQEALITARKEVGEKLGKLRGTSQPAEARLEEIANKGVESYSPQEVAQQIKGHFDKLPASAPKMEEDLAGATTRDLTAKAEPLGSREYTPHPDFGYQKGDMVTLKSTNPNLPDVKAMYNGPNIVGSPEARFQLKEGIPETDPAKLKANMEMNKQFPDLPQITNPVRHGPESDVAQSTLESYGYNIPEPKGNHQAELEHLLKMRNNAYNQIEQTTLDQSGNAVKKISSNDERAFKGGIDRINKRIEQLPGGKEIRKTEKEFSETSKLYKDLQGRMKEPGQAESFLRQVFKNPTGKNKDYLDKLAKLEVISGEPILSSLQEAFASQAKGLSYETLKHPIASLIKKGLPSAGNALKVGAKSSGPLIQPIARGLQTPFNTPDMQSLRDKLNAK